LKNVITVIDDDAGRHVFVHGNSIRLMLHFMKRRTAGILLRATIDSADDERLETQDGMEL
jgi:hypothetical protein